MFNVFRSRKKGVTQQDTQKRTDTLYPKVYSRKSTLEFYSNQNYEETELNTVGRHLKDVII